MALRHHLRHTYSVRGHSDKELREAQIEIEIGEALGEPDTICWGHYGAAFAKARMGRLGEAHEHMRRAFAAIEGRASDLSRSIALNHHGFVLLQSSAYAQATSALENARRLTERRLMYFDYLTPAYPLLIEALVGPDWLHARSDPKVRRARALRWKTRFFAWRFPNMHPHALRVEGRLWCALGKRDRALPCFDKSITSARELGHDYDLARALLDLSVLDSSRGEPLRAEAIEVLKRLKAVIPWAEKWQLGNCPGESCVAPQWSTQDQQAGASW
jgi:tetratricopeptide (TPR) repeat protein